MKANYDNLDTAMPIAIAVSGGIDSMCLLHNAYRKGYNITAFSVNHHIRPNASEDIQLVASFCAQENIPFLSFDVYALEFAQKEKLSIETSARILRHQIYNHLSEKYKYILLAHHQSDQTESILMHIVRGSGINGIVGMQQKEGFLIRPLLETPKESIIDYAKKYNIPYSVDNTNFDQNYTRNYLRLSVIPKLKNINSNFDNSIQKLSASLRVDKDFIDQQSKKYFHLIKLHKQTHIQQNLTNCQVHNTNCEVHKMNCQVHNTNNEVHGSNCQTHNTNCEVHKMNCQVHNTNNEVHGTNCQVNVENDNACSYNDGALSRDFVTIDALELMKLHDSLAIRVVIHAFKLLEIHCDIESVHLKSILELCQGQSGKKLNLPHGLEACKQFNQLVIRTANAFGEHAPFIFSKSICISNGSLLKKDFVFQFIEAVESNTRHKVEYFQNHNDSNNQNIKGRMQSNFSNKLTIDSQKLYEISKQEDLTIRKWQSGDRIKLGVGSKKVGDFLQQRKIELMSRDKCVVLAYGKEVLMIFGLEISTQLYVDKSTTDILVIT